MNSQIQILRIVFVNSDYPFLLIVILMKYLLLKWIGTAYSMHYNCTNLRIGMFHNFQKVNVVSALYDVMMLR